MKDSSENIIEIKKISKEEDYLNKKFKIEKEIEDTEKKLQDKLDNLTSVEGDKNSGIYSKKNQNYDQHEKKENYNNEYSSTTKLDSIEPSNDTQNLKVARVDYTKQIKKDEKIEEPISNHKDDKVAEDIKGDIDSSDKKEKLNTQTTNNELNELLSINEITNPFKKNRDKDDKDIELDLFNTKNLILLINALIVIIVILITVNYVISSIYGKNSPFTFNSINKSIKDKKDGIEKIKKLNTKIKETIYKGDY